MSLGAPATVTAMSVALQEAEDAGVLVIASAGNENTTDRRQLRQLGRHRRAGLQPREQPPRSADRLLRHVLGGTVVSGVVGLMLTRTPNATPTQLRDRAGISKGCTTNLFCPDDSVTRAQMTSFSCAPSISSSRAIRSRPLRQTSSTSLPRTWPSWLTSWARAASDSANASCTSMRTLPASTSRTSAARSSACGRTKQ